MRRRDPIDRPEFLSTPTGRELWRVLAPVLAHHGFVRSGADAEFFARVLLGCADWIDLRESWRDRGFDEEQIAEAGYELLAKAGTGVKVMVKSPVPRIH